MSRSGRHSALSSVDALVSRVTKRWLSEAETLHRRGADEQAVVLQSCANELTEEGRLFSLEALTLGRAAEESGFSYSALEKMVRDGTLPNVGKKGAPRVHRGDLPSKPGSCREPPKDEPSIAELALAGNVKASHIS